MPFGSSVRLSNFMRSMALDDLLKCKNSGLHWPILRWNITYPANQYDIHQK